MIWIVIAVVAVAVLGILFQQFIAPRYAEISFSQFLEKVNNGEINYVNISSYKLEGYFKDANGATKNYFYCYSWSPYTSGELAEILMGAGVDVTFANPNAGGIWSGAFTFLGIILVAVIFWLMMRSAAGGGGKVMSIGKTKAHVQSNLKVRFADVAGAEEEKEELQEVVEFLKTPKKFLEVGAKIPRGVLLVGPPGTGKTLFAKAVAGEAGVPFFAVSGSDFVEMYVGVGASRVRDLFDMAKKNQPCIVFIDEIDAVGRHRGAGLGGGHDEREQTLNQILVQMDGFETNEGIIVMAATNRADILDPALLRPGRFDRQIHVNLPDVKGREQILKVHARNKPIAPDVNFRTVARMTVGFSGADLANLLNEAAILTARADKKLIGNIELYEAIDKILMGLKKKSHVVTEADKRICAYHESGHAILAGLCKHCDPVHEVTIIPRGNGAGGFTMTRPDEDGEFRSYNQMVDNICMTLGGRAAEEIVVKDVTQGASADLQSVSATARRMVTQYGMSEKLGLVAYENNQPVFMGMEYEYGGGNRNGYSQKTASVIDDEIRRLIAEQHERALRLLTENRSILDNMSRVLVEKETIFTEEVEMLMKGASYTEVIEFMDREGDKRAANPFERFSGAAPQPGQA
ncbi:MAG TPA: ATP-dependent zinc metalloprotease FtsH [Candidatus Scatosoma pullistercoris]|uniref:ATP-dependent zinc metalloprotease FtsH n=1 Tax=Candidatus Scatosoma pullistercoris TaxID=2840934 RepID=A0A9D1MF52_9FIRM|nr:ATP-dependent zinc metalloprotease FtsH [Candidatus Scatosoma pullistercoris]